MKLARPEDRATIVQKGVSTPEIIKLMNKLHAPTLNLEVSVGRRGGVLHHAKEVAREYLGLNDDNVVDVNTLTITGEIDGEPAFIDLIENRLMDEIEVDQEERRTLPYRNRRTSLRRAWTNQLDELRKYGATS